MKINNSLITSKRYLIISLILAFFMRSVLSLLKFAHMSGCPQKEINHLRSDFNTLYKFVPFCRRQTADRNEFHYSNVISNPEIAQKLSMETTLSNRN